MSSSNAFGFVPKPASNGGDALVQPLLTDLYQLTMCYGYWYSGMHNAPAVFDLFFRKNPFGGEYTIFAGLEDCLYYIKNFRFSKSDIDFLRLVLPGTTNPAFFNYLETLDCKDVTIHAAREGSLVFPKVPLITVEGPLAICQLLETTLLTLVNFSSLVATNALRFRNVAGNYVQLLEFGLRRAQGPNGGLTASKYCFLGGFDGTSNLMAGKLFGIPVVGTQAHSFICSFTTASDLKVRKLKVAEGATELDIYDLSEEKLNFLMQKCSWGVSKSEVSAGELCAFCAYAVAFPTAFLALIDTYDVLRSGVVNFCAVTLALHELGYRSIGCRIDSGDLSYLSKEVRNRFKMVAALDSSLEWFSKLSIIASNDINEDTIVSLNEQQHEIDAFGIGTHLVTCQKQPALGCVYKLVALSGIPKIKLTEDVTKIQIPGRKNCYRLYGKGGFSICDLMTLDTEPKPKENEPILCRHPFQESKRALVVAKKVETIQLKYWENGQLCERLPTLLEMKRSVKESFAKLRKDHRRLLNPTPFKISVSEELYNFLHKIWLQSAPIGQLE